MLNTAVALLKIVLGTIGSLITITLMIPFIILKVAIPLPVWRRVISIPLLNMVDAWQRVMAGIVRISPRTSLDVRFEDEFSVTGRYLLISNHSAWSDIPILFDVFRGRMPFTRYFIKQELIWLPIIGLGAWAVDCPFMKRYSSEQIRQNPELKGKDIETTRKSCEVFRHQPVTIVNFAEGTRCTEEKRITRKSPYRYLLRPKAGGIAFMMKAMGEHLDGLIDVTIAYPDGSEPHFLDYLGGNMKEVKVRGRLLEIPDHLKTGDYQNDEYYRQQFQQWVSDYWRSKDEEIAELKREIAQE